MVANADVANADVATADLVSNDMTMFMNQGGGVLGDPVTIAIGQNPSSVFWCDLEADGDEDLLVAFRFGLKDLFNVCCDALSNCSDHGRCVGFDECECDPGWSSPDCAISVEPIPAMSTWGLMNIGMLVLSGGTILLRPQKRGA